MDRAFVKCKHCGHKVPSGLSFESQAAMLAAKADGGKTVCARCGKSTSFDSKDLEFMDKKAPTRRR